MAGSQNGSSGKGKDGMLDRMDKLSSEDWKKIAERAKGIDDANDDRVRKRIESGTEKKSDNEGPASEHETTPS